MGLVKTTDGTVTLAGPNAYTGPTRIEAGTLGLTGNGQIDPSSAIENDATLVVADGTHALGNITGAGSTLVGGSAMLTVASIVQDSLTIGGNYSSLVGAYSAVDSATAPTAAPVPEPGMLLLLVSLGVTLAAGHVCRKR